MNDDKKHISQALTLAAQAAAQNEVPIGAIVVDAHGQIIGRGYNQVEGKKSQLAHAEIEAINEATQALNNWRLDGCTIYVTLEPCKMCMGLIQLSRLDRVVYGADSPRFGHTDPGTNIYKEVAIEKGVSATESAALIKEFFAKQRRR